MNDHPLMRACAATPPATLRHSDTRNGHRPHRLATCLVAALVLGLSACGGGRVDDDHEDHDHEHGDVHIESLGRLAVTEVGANRVRVMDAEDGDLLSSFTLASAPSAVYASPDGRYALLPQRTNNSLQFVDGGLWQEDHGDHLHDYAADPRLLAFTLGAPLPTHVSVHEGLAAMFNDGADASSTSGATAATVAVLSDTSIGAGAPEASLTLPSPMHGAAQPRGDYLLTTFRPVGAASTLPDQVELYQRNGSGYTFVRRFAETCPALHGSASNEDHTAFGCSDGVLVITQVGDEFSARKINNLPDMGSVRIGTLAGHHEQAQFVGIASPGHLFAVDPEAGTLTRINWADSRTRRAHGFDAEAENFLVLDDQGSLHFLDPADGWAVRAVLSAVPTMPTAAPFPTLAASRAAQTVFITDPLGRALVEVDTHEARVNRRIGLDFVPAGVAWLGVPAHEHDHGH